MHLKYYLSSKVIYLLGFLSGVFIMLIIGIYKRPIIAEFDINYLIKHEAVMLAKQNILDEKIKGTFNKKLRQIKSKLPKNVILVKKGSLYSYHKPKNYNLIVLDYLND